MKSLYIILTQKYNEICETMMGTCNIVQNIYLHGITRLVVVILNFRTEVSLCIFA